MDTPMKNKLNGNMNFEPSNEPTPLANEGNLKKCPKSCFLTCLEDFRQFLSFFLYIAAKIIVRIHSKKFQKTFISLGVSVYWYNSRRFRYIQFS